VRHLALCHALSDAKLRRLAPSIKHVGLAPGQLILPDGRRQITGLLLPGDFLGAPCDDRYCFSAEAVGRGELCRLPASLLQRLCQRHSELEHRLLQAMSEKLCGAQAHMLTLGRKTALSDVST
jgi:CRP/FNR family transcriptional regulator